MINVEKAFGEYVRSAGGELVCELISKSPSFRNADYLFRRHKFEPVIAELKCLTKDLFKEGYQEKLDDLFNDWINRRLVAPFWGIRKFQSPDLPLECQHEMMAMLGKPVKKDVLAANKQIKETKEHFGLTQAKGLLLLVNDGNYSLESNVVLYLVDRALGVDCSSINSVIYFTVNMAARIPGTGRPGLIWVSGPRKGVPQVSEAFLDSLRDGWLKFYEGLIGEAVPLLTSADQKAFEDLAFIQPPKPRSYYRTRNKGAVALRRRIGAQIERIVSCCRCYDMGEQEEVVGVADAVQELLLGGSNRCSLVRDYFGTDEIRLVSTTMFEGSGHGNFLGFLGIDVPTGGFRSMLDDAKRRLLLPLGQWCDEQVLSLLDAAGQTVSRREIVLCCVGSKGNGLPDPVLRAKYDSLVAGLGMKLMGKKAGQDVEIRLHNAHFAALRQIGHELLRSDELMALAR